MFQLYILSTTLAFLSSTTCLLILSVGPSSPPSTEKSDGSTPNFCTRCAFEVARPFARSMPHCKKMYGKNLKKLQVVPGKKHDVLFIGQYFLIQWKKPAISKNLTRLRLSLLFVHPVRHPVYHPTPHTCISLCTIWSSAASATVTALLPRDSHHSRASQLRSGSGCCVSRSTCGEGMALLVQQNLLSRWPADRYLLLYVQYTKGLFYCTVL